MRKCSLCGEYKDESEFFVKRKGNGGSPSLHSHCKECHSANEMERYYKKQEFIDSKKTPCVKCGEKRIRCISFHHKKPSEKEFTIGAVRKSSFVAIQKEIDKCICLCLNCHTEFHHFNKKIGISLEEYILNY